MELSIPLSKKHEPLFRQVYKGLRKGNPEGGSWVTVRVGVATALSRQGGTMRMPESLLLAADTAMYKAKREGRNRVATALLVAFKEP